MLQGASMSAVQLNRPAATEAAKNRESISLCNSRVSGDSSCKIEFYLK